MYNRINESEWQKMRNRAKFIRVLMATNNIAQGTLAKDLDMSVEKLRARLNCTVSMSFEFIDKVSEYFELNHGARNALINGVSIDLNDIFYDGK